MVTLLASGALFGKILGFARELLMARVFGASLVADSFRGAISAALLPIGPLQNEGVPAVMIPMHRGWQQEGTAAEKLTALSLGLSSIALLIVVVVEIAGGAFVRLIVGGMQPEGQQLVLSFLRIMALGAPACVLLNCLAAGEIATGRSRITALRPAVLNISIMTGIALYLATANLMFLPIFFSLSFNLLGAWCIATMWREGALDAHGFAPALVSEVTLDFFRRLRPLLLQPLAEQGQAWLERFVASTFVVGTLASMDYARTLTDTAVLLVSQPIGMVVLYKGHSSDLQSAAMSFARPILAIAIPVCIFIGVFSTDIVSIVFARGAFDHTAVQLTSGALTGIAVGSWAMTLGMILLRFLNSAGRNGRAALILASGLAVNAILNLVAWRAEDFFGTGSTFIGLGEAARGLVVLAGTTIALNAEREVLRLLALSLLPASFMACFCVVVKATWSEPLAQIFVGGFGCLLTIFLAFLILMPTEIKALRRRIVTTA
jgi:putative peptidoglycan lipid II flippase